MCCGQHAKTGYRWVIVHIIIRATRLRHDIIIGLQSSAVVADDVIRIIIIIILFITFRLIESWSLSVIMYSLYSQLAV